MLYSCGSCGFQWKSKTERIPKRCPYCSDTNIAKTKLAQQIIDDV